jgi:pyruvate/2-oxoglutarate dehydrogenase complex dihydrolipoamide dehydrogenase (E3) component
MSSEATAKTNMFDIIIIGTGVAASTVAYKCNSAGWKLLLLTQDHLVVLVLCVAVIQKKCL